MQLDTVKHKVHKIITDSYTEGDIDDNRPLVEYEGISEIELDYIVEEVCDVFEVYFELNEQEYQIASCNLIAGKVYNLIKH